MAGRSVTILPATTPDAKLRIQFDVPDEMIPRRPTITIQLNDALLESFTPSEAHLVREYDVPGTAGDNVLVMQIDPTYRGDDPRDLGLLVRNLSWGPQQ